MATSLTPVSSPFAVFRNRSFALMWMGQLVSTAGSALTSLAASILIFRFTGSALSVGLMLVATAVPTLLVGLIAGVFVDRYDWHRAAARRSTQYPARSARAGEQQSFRHARYLAGRLPSLSGLTPKDRQALVAQACVTQASPGTTIIRHGDTGDAAYFVLSGRAVAGIATEGGGYRSLSTLSPGDFFREIAAQTGAPRTANVVADELTTLLQVPAKALRGLMTHPALSQLFLAKMSERLSRMHTSDLPRLAGLDQEALRDLRTPEPRPAAA